VSERFNFYDIYGYLIPGLTLVTLLWLPFGIIQPSSLNAGLGAAAAAVLVGYIVGHFVAATAGGLISAKTARSKDGQPAFPSIVLLNPSDDKLNPELKTRLAKNVAASFSLDLHVGEEADDHIGNIRQAAFFLCRPVVNKITAYPEQFEGLYAMMSSVAIDFALGFAYMLGWTAACYVNFADATLVAYAGIALALLAVVAFAVRDARTPRNAVSALALLFFCCAYVLGLQTAIPPDRMPVFPIIAALCLAASFRFKSQYRYFANEFAKAVWTYFPDTPASSLGHGAVRKDVGEGASGR
jgi:hypothetical protein